MKAVVAAFNQEKALVGAFSVITNLWMELFEALETTATALCLISPALEYLNVEREKKIPLPPANTIYISASIPLMVLFNGSFA